MSRKWLLFLICLGLFSYLGSLARATSTLEVDETKARIIFAENDPRVVLPITNSLGHDVNARIRVELLDSGDGTQAWAERDVTVKPGTNTASLPIKFKLPAKTTDVLWYRLAYQISPADTSQFDSVKGVVAFSGITPDLFALYVATPAKAVPGATYRMRVRAAHPLTARAIRGVNITAQIQFDETPRDVVLKQEARTDADGFATLEFQLPNSIADDDGEIMVTGTLGALQQSAQSEISLDHDGSILVSTDKPLYQPGQLLHTRVLMVNSARRALAGRAATLKISDPENSLVFRTDLTASRFGAASADWQIPANTKLGDYRIEVELDDDHYEAYGGATVKISRYDLPNFSVEAKPDRPYYLPGQNAQIEIRANYLFGQPVKRGHVRLVRETERRWNYREQKYETEEGAKYEGDVDGDGRFLARVDLNEEHAKLAAEDYSRYADLTYAAYFTDATTNRTEQRRFDLRLTKNQIHLYIVRERRQQARDFPFQFYLSAAYADGAPASCEVIVNRIEAATSREQKLRTVQTNRFGLAKISNLTLAGEDNEDASLIFRARDRQGATGTHTETISAYEKTAVRIETDKSLYRDGEPIKVNINSNRADMVVALDVINDRKVMQSHFVQLRNGQGSILIPYRSEFAGEVTIAGYSQTTESDDDGVGSRTVLYPHDRDLKFSLALNQENYRPGDEANATFVTHSAGGRPVESALGVLIFDKAVEERARTDRQFRGNHGFDYAYCFLSGCEHGVSGITRKNLDQIDLSKPLAEGLDLVAEVLLLDTDVSARIFQSERYQSDPREAFADLLASQKEPLQTRLDSQYEESCDYPTSLGALRRVALFSGIRVDELRDPWDTPYRITFFTERDHDVIEMMSAGADKRFGSNDDFELLRIERPYFRFTGEAINRAAATFHTRTGGFIRDEATLKSELRRQGIEFDSLRDPWGQPYRLEFGVSQTKFFIYARTTGPDRHFTSGSAQSDDALVWTSSIDYAQDVRAQLEAALDQYFTTKAELPQNETEFAAALRQSNIETGQLRDPWGRSYYVTFKRTAIYSNRITIYNYATYGEQAKQKTELTPITQYRDFIYLSSDGLDGKQGTVDDFNVATISRVTAEQSGADQTPQTIKPAVNLPGSKGAITGIVTDPSGAVVPGAKVTVKNLRTEATYEAETNDGGIYIVRNVPAGRYQLIATSPGFRNTVIVDVFVRSSNVTKVDIMLQVGGVTSTVEVTASEQTINSSQFSVSGLRAGALLTLSPGVVKPATQIQLTTPRLREYFPETLVWQPSLETDKRGRAELKFKLADNITTWKMSVIGSTEDGQIGLVEKEIKSFQPFFVEHEPPRILTEGDVIALPVVVRNYLDRAQPINLEIKPESWFSLLGPAAKRSEVAAGDAARITFDFRASASIKDGKQRVTAIGTEANDAIEKPVTVHPDGDEQSVAASDVASPNATVTLDIPTDAIASSVHAELKIYPDLLTHVAESVEGIMQRPYGCGEQTISSTYPSLLLLGKFKQTGEGSHLQAKASRYLREGYNRLLNYRDQSGGFTYWGRGEPDLALTVYALRFLTNAQELIEVDDDVVKQARAWVLKQQRSDGSWPPDGGGDENKLRTATITAYIARVLAASVPANPGNSRQPSLEVKRALDYLTPRIEEIDEPYMIASYALAAIEVGDTVRASRAITKLRALAHQEKGGAYWTLETNTPFYAWGLAGRIETTALAVQALTRANSRDTDGQLINEGILFLLRAKDHYGVWYSTQATINVLDTLLTFVTRDPGSAAPAADILVNGRPVKSVQLPPPTKPTAPIIIDISQFVVRNTNRIEVRQRNSAHASIQAVAGYFVPWTSAKGTRETNQQPAGAGQLRLTTRFDKTTAQVGDSITCHVEAERIAFSGYGMMLAEIGLPPGADVDRASLEEAMKNSDWGISQYDILPDRVVVYLWPRAGGIKFDFKFRPRFGIEAQTAASSIYDYYNPEARATVAPAKFVVK